ncbi:MAG: metallophosphoesterase, partial [Myxococcota bacterium]
GDDSPGTDDGDSGTGSDSGDDSGADSGGEDTGSVGETPAKVRFVALGDGGTGSDDQYAVADTVAAVCAERGCDFALYLGDNIYNDGVTSVTDSQWEEKFEAPYAVVDFPFYAALGNHDYGGGGGGFEVERAQAQVDYTNESDKWRMPAKFYTHAHGDATFFALDTTPLDWSRVEEQTAWLPGQLAAATTKWKIAYGHHPYISNGDHGNANDNFGPFFEDNVCGQVDLYLAGHDHHLEWLEPQCGTEHVISGAAAKLRGVEGSNPSFYGTSTLGFVWFEIDGDTLTGVMYDVDGNELFRRVVTKQ